MKPDKPMKRSELKPGDKPLVRRTELRNKTELRSTSKPARVADLSRIKPLKATWKVLTSDELHARTLAHQRSNGVCEICDQARVTNLQHRLPEGQGGPTDVRNLLGVCGMGNASGCHGRIHQGSTEAYANGWAVQSGAGHDYRTTPVLLALHGFVLLTADGGTTPYVHEEAS